MNLKCLVIVTTSLLSANGAFAETLTLASPAPGPAPLNKVFQIWADNVAEATKGEVKVNVVAGGTLGRHDQLLDRVQSGVIDISWDFQGYYPNRFPRSSVAELPFTYETSLDGSIAFQNMLDEGQFGSEYKDVIVLGMFAFPNNSVMLTKELPESNDLSGLKISAQNPAMYAAAQALGAVPISMGIPDWYAALSRRTIDGAIVAFTAVPAFRFQEVATHYYKTPIGGNTAFMFMGRNVFESLSEQHQKEIMSVSGTKFSEMIGHFLDDQASKGEGLAATTADEIITLNDNLSTSWKKRLSTVRNKWLEAGNGDQALIDAMNKAVTNVQNSN